MALDSCGCKKSNEISTHKDNAIEQYPDGIFVPTVAKQTSIERGRTEPDGEVGRVKLVYSNYKNLFILSGSETEVVIPKTKQKGLPTELFIWHPWEEGKHLTVSWDEGVSIDGVAGPSSLVLRYSAWLHIIRDKGDNWVTVSTENINDTLANHLDEAGDIVAEMQRLQGLTAADREQTRLDRVATGQDRQAVGTLKTDVTQLKADTNQIKTDTNQLKTDTAAIKTAVDGVAATVNAQNTNVNTKHGQVVTMQADVTEKHTEVLAEADRAAGLVHSLTFAPIAQRKFSDLTMGTSPEDEIYLNARSGTQGYTTIEVAGVRYQFVSQNAQSEPERKRIVQFPWGDDGTAKAHIAFSNLLDIGHGQDLSALVRGANLYLYSQTAVARGYSRTLWKGAATAQADVETFDFLPDWVAGATVGVSKNGKYIAFGHSVNRWNYGETGHMVQVFDLATLEAASDKSMVMPLAKFRLSKQKSLGAHFLQGLAVSDAGLVATYHGYTHPAMRNWVQFWDMQGNLLRAVSMDGPRAEAGYDGFYKGTYQGFPCKFEPEGIDFLDPTTLLFQTVEHWRTGADIVSYQGKNFAMIKEGSSTVTGTSPEDTSTWVRTDLPATRGAYDPAATYNCGASTRRTKTIHGIVIDDGNIRNKPLDGGICANDHMAEMSNSSNTVDLGWHSGDWNAAMWSSALEGFRRGFGFYSGNQWRIYDTRAEGDNTEYFSIDCDSPNSLNQLRTKSGTLANGYGENWYHADGGTVPHGKREYAGGILRRELKATGENTYWSTGPVERLDRSEVGHLSMWLVNGVHHGIIAGYATQFVIGSRGEYNFTFGAGLADTAPKEWQVNFVTGDIHPTTDNLYGLGTAIRRVKEVFAGVGAVNTSDEREKEQWRDLTEAETAAAREIKASIRGFKFSDSVAEKGGNARVHFGVGAQTVKAILESHGLVAEDYAFFCYDEWEAKEDELDGEGNVISAGYPSGSRYGIRYEELLAFIIATM